LSRPTIPASRPSGLALHGLPLVHHLAVVVDVDGVVTPILEAEPKLTGEFVGVGYRHDAKVLLLGSEEDANEPLLGPILRAERCLRQALMMSGQADFWNVPMPSGSNRWGVSRHGDGHDPDSAIIIEWTPRTCPALNLEETFDRSSWG
jgi:hypothetical protein